MTHNHHIQALLVTKGHNFEREPFFEMIDSVSIMEGNRKVDWTHVEHPAAQAVLNANDAQPYNVIVFYDMPGVIFTGQQPPFETYAPSEKFKSDFLGLLQAGKPMIFLHHAIAAWPTWPEYAEIIGGRFHFLPGELRGTSYPGSGYKFRVHQEISVQNPSHPIVQGLPEKFPFREEAYLMPVFEDDVEPILRSDFEFEAKNFKYGGVDFQQHPKGSKLVGWTKKYENSSIAYLQFAHERLGYEDPYFRKLLNNALTWAKQEADSIKIAAT